MFFLHLCSESGEPNWTQCGKVMERQSLILYTFCFRCKTNWCTSKQRHCKGDKIENRVKMVSCNPVKFRRDLSNVWEHLWSSICETVCSHEFQTVLDHTQFTECSCTYQSNMTNAKHTLTGHNFRRKSEGDTVKFANTLEKKKMLDSWRGFPSYPHL